MDVSLDVDVEDIHESVDLSPAQDAFLNEPVGWPGFLDASLGSQPYALAITSEALVGAALEPPPKKSAKLTSTANHNAL